MCKRNRFILRTVFICRKLVKKPNEFSCEQFTFLDVGYAHALKREKALVASSQFEKGLAEYRLFSNTTLTLIMGIIGYCQSVKWREKKGGIKPIVNRLLFFECQRLESCAQTQRPTNELSLRVEPTKAERSVARSPSPFELLVFLSCSRSRSYFQSVMEPSKDNIKLF